MSIVNIACYKFVPVSEPELWREPLKERCQSLELRGTIILAPEGINLFLAGSRAAIDSFVQYLRKDPLFGGSFDELEIKESFSESQPFRKMVVRLAKEIITMRHSETPCPSQKRAPAVSAKTLKVWLDRGYDDDGREVVLLDTRNQFEVDLGTFENAKSLEIGMFSEFPSEFEKFNQSISLADKTVVSFCTGGVRCEKAVLFMENLGLPKVFQLDGGILRYFEEVGGEHWQGECFVFDDRYALDPALQPTSKIRPKE
ncbi:MAG: sulfurtransferase [Candidatus Obscuribacterales bacterium]|jgi:UPF0176 protein|nr:sulfurtransferase [Candidatus Obscuribacterales bacterium]